jgi:hypothetical protein
MTSYQTLAPLQMRLILALISMAQKAGSVTRRGATGAETLRGLLADGAECGSVAG